MGSPRACWLIEYEDERKLKNKMTRKFELRANSVTPDSSVIHALYLTMMIDSNEGAGDHKGYVLGVVTLSGVP